jgi:hypothetical protein
MKRPLATSILKTMQKTTPTYCLLQYALLATLLFRNTLRRLG